MEGANRLFAGEFTGIQMTGDRDLRSPTGAVCHRIYLSGALTEVTETQAGDLLARVADPTGIFQIRIGRRSIRAAAALSAISPPAFVAVTGMARMYRRQLIVEAEAVTEASRALRDIWILRTSEQTLGRLEMNAADMPDEIVHETASMMQKALEVVHNDPSEKGFCLDPGARLLEIIADMSGPRGMAVDDLLAAGKVDGISEQTVRNQIKRLLEEGDCYSPSSGHIRLL